MASIFEYSRYKKQVFKIMWKIYFQGSHKCDKLHVNEMEQSDEYEGPASWEKKSLWRYTIHRTTTSKKTRYNIMPRVLLLEFDSFTME